MFIPTGRVLYTAKKEIHGKPVKADPGKKAMYRQRGHQVLTGAATVQLVRQHGQRLPHVLRLHAAVQRAVHLREAAITGVARAAGAIRVAVVSWAGNRRLAARAASEHIHIRRASNSLKKVPPADLGVQAQKARLVELPLEVAAGRKAALEVKKGVRLPILTFKRTNSVVYHWILFSFLFYVH
jgi:hypothetical protein